MEISSTKRYGGESGLEFGGIPPVVATLKLIGKARSLAT
jgi:hypothetical protein